MTTFMKARLGDAIARRGRLARAVMAAACVGLFGTACDVHGVSGPGTLATLEITPNPQTLGINATQQFTVIGKDFSGAVVPTAATWTVASGGGAISGSGMFTAGTKTGTYANTITATQDGKSATATVVVTAGPLAAITLTPTPVTLAIGATQQYVAVGTDAAGNVVPFTPTWSVVAGGGSISGTGLFTAGTVSGTYTNTVQVSHNNIRATGTVIVTPGPLATLVVTPNPVTLNVGATQQYSAVGKDANGNTVAFTPTWTVVAGGGSINASGLFTAGNAPGTFANTVKATAGAISGSATVTVTAGPLATITVTPNPQTLAAGATQQFTAVGTDAAGNVLAITPGWSIAAGGGTIDFATGVFKAGTTAGTFANTVRATVGSVSGFATVTVTQGPATSLTVVPNPVTLQTGGTQQFTATARDAAGTPVAATVTWSVVNGGGTITAGGLFTAGINSGTFANTVQASTGSLAATATVTVTPTLSSIFVTPAAATILPNATQQFSATGIDASGNSFAISPVWSVALGVGGVNGGSINATTGLFTSNGTAGSFVITATSGGKSGTATVTVSSAPPVLTTITLSPNPAILNTGSVQQFSAVGRDQNGNVFVIPPGAVWFASPLSGTIDGTGRFTAGATAGTYTDAVTLTSGVVVGKATVIESAPPAAPLFDYLRSTAGNGMMAGTAISCAGPATIQGNYAISPGSAPFSGPCVVSGVAISPPTAALQQLDLTAAYNDLFDQVRNPCPPANVIVAPGELGGTTKAAGVYCSPASTMFITGTLTLDGGNDPNAVFIFQVGTGLTTAGDIVLTRGAQAKNVYFVVGSSATIGTASHIQGNIVALTSITTVTGATLNGRALARNGAVSLGTGSVITLP